MTSLDIARALGLRVVEVELPSPRGGKSTARALVDWPLAHTPLPRAWIKKWLAHWWRGCLLEPAAILAGLRRNHHLTGADVSRLAYAHQARGKLDTEDFRNALRLTGFVFPKEFAN